MFLASTVLSLLGEEELKGRGLESSTAPEVCRDEVRGAIVTGSRYFLNELEICFTTFLIYSSEGGRRGIISVQAVGTRVHLCSCELLVGMMQQLQDLS